MTKQDTPRRRALKLLTEILEQSAYSNLALRKGLQGLDARAAALVKQLVFGTVTYRVSLDYLLGKWLLRPLAALDPNVRNILRLGLYQIVYLKTPDHAAVSESVNLAKEVSHRGSANLVNAILRRAVREQARLPWPQTNDPAADLAIRYSFPEWMTARWVDRLGVAAAEAFCQANNQPPGIDLRVNSLRSSVAELLQELRQAGAEVLENPLVPSSVHLSGGDVHSLPALRDGRCTVQGAASTLVGLVVDPQPGQLVYDICAAPGGKALHLAELMNDEGRVVAVENHANRLRLIRSAAARMQIDSVEAVHMDARKLADTGWEPAPCVLVDAPCSGLGVIRRKPDIRWHRSHEDLRELSSLQTEILLQAASLVQPGGILVYSVCSTEPEETNTAVDSLLRARSDFQPVGWPVQIAETLVREVVDGRLTTYPHVHNMDGFFICRLQRRS